MAAATGEAGSIAVPLMVKVLAEQLVELLAECKAFSGPTDET